ncbi:uncharacterized protein LOC119590998 [Penaeus monodon]|uniref:uncharacterized protein LOC119590998 n=1 Tax=Penaeus monodon TaxID=6687 RepID=UPI0018A702C6|nr:uncharacterized protein LOC119590998 [Penaeus monodon]
MAVERNSKRGHIALAGTSVGSIGVQLVGFNQSRGWNQGRKADTPAMSQPGTHLGSAFEMAIAFVSPALLPRPRKHFEPSKSPDCENTTSGMACLLTSTFGSVTY